MLSPFQGHSEEKTVKHAEPNWSHCRLCSTQVTHRGVTCLMVVLKGNERETGGEFTLWRVPSIPPMSLPFDLFRDFCTGPASQSLDGRSYEAATRSKTAVREVVASGSCEREDIIHALQQTALACTTHACEFDLQQCMCLHGSFVLSVCYSTDIAVI